MVNIHSIWSICEPDQEKTGKSIGLVFSVHGLECE